jgi:ribosomal protein L11 methyltransferase
MSTWRKLIFSPLQDATSDSESFAYELMELGALGTIQEGTSVVAFTQGVLSNHEILLRHVEESGWELVREEEVPEENWNNSCPELWETVQIGSFTVTPIASLEAGPSEAPAPDTLRLIPGLGFGTGHHPTTWMCLEYLSTKVTQGSTQPTHILDVGTGSGILSIGAKRLFPSATVIGIDIDPLALDNARDNCTLNHLTDCIDLSDTPLDQVNGSFDLIFANVYKEVLIQLSPDIKRLATPGGTVILSGIAVAVRDQVVHCYRETLGWRLVEDRVKENWVCLVFEVNRED